jgi:hypothetical protein
MFANRLRLVAAGAALVMSASLTVASSATAEPGAQQGGQERTITIKGVEPRPNVFIAKGRVFPAYENQPAIMQRKLKSAKRWSTWKTFETNGSSRYRQRIAALERIGVVCYRVKIQGDSEFVNSFSRKVCIRTF